MTQTPCAPSAPAEGYDTLEQTLRNARSLLVVLGSRTDSIIAEMVRQLDHHIAEQTAASPDDASELAKAREEIAGLQAANEEMRAQVKSERDACLTIAHEECMGTTHGKGAWKVMQAFLKIRARIEARAALAFSSADGEGK